MGIIYFLWIGIFNVMVIAQFWGFASDLYTQDQGKRLFPVIGVGASLGAWLGSVRAGTVVHDFGAPRLLIGAGIVLVVCTLLAGVINRVVTRAAPSGAGGREAAGPRGRLRSHLQRPLPQRSSPYSWCC